MAGDGSHADGAGAAKIGPYIKDSTPFWPAAPRAPKGAPNILVVLFDDVGFSDFGCYGSPIATPTIDGSPRADCAIPASTPRRCARRRARRLLTGRNHHSVGVGCLANFDSGYPGYRGKIAREAGTIAEMLRPHGYRNYMLGKWHVTPLTESGPTGPFDGWPLGRGFDRYYGFMDAETDQYAPELMRDNSSIPVPGTYAERLSPHRRSGRSVDPLRRRPHRGAARPAVADMGRVRRMPRAASGAARSHHAVRRDRSATAGTSSASAGSRGRRRWGWCRRIRGCRRAMTA